MKKHDFIRRRRSEWTEFEVLIDQLSSVRRRSLTVEELSRASRLIRELSSDLALVRSREWGTSLSEYLNLLLTRGHNSLYQASPSGLLPVIRFLVTDFPQLIRSTAGYHLVSGVLFMGSLGIAWVAIQSDPSLASRLLPAEQLDMYDHMYDNSGLGSGIDEQTELRAAMAGFYVQHNVGIALRCFANGLALGVGTIHALLFNGIVIGAVSGYVISAGHGERFLSFVITHGAFELTAIVLAGGGGLMLADSVFHHGQETRLGSLRKTAVPAVEIAGGAAVMLMIAALIEAFWSPATGIPSVVKFLVGGLLWVTVGLYFLLAGKGRTT